MRIQIFKTVIKVLPNARYRSLFNCIFDAWPCLCLQGIFPPTITEYITQVILCVHTFLMRQLVSREKMLLDQVDGVANLISALHPTSPNSKNKPQVCTSCIFLVRLRFRFCVGICVHQLLLRFKTQQLDLSLNTFFKWQMVVFNCRP